MKKIILIMILLCGHFSMASIQVAITVDDLPAHGQLPSGVTRTEITQKMLAVFKKYNIPEVYGFINAGNVEFKKEDLEVLKLWRAAGYPLANHTYSHLDINKVSTKEYQTDILRNEKMLADLSGGADWHYFRYPYLREGISLETRNEIRSFLFKHQYKIAQVTIDFEDWSWNNPYARCKDKSDAKSIEQLKSSYIENAGLALKQEVDLAQFLFKRPIKHILLLHIGAFDSEMAESLIKKYLAAGVEFIPLSEAYKDEIYSQDPKLASKYGSELTFQLMKARGLKLSDAGIEKVPDITKTLENICL